EELNLGSTELDAAERDPVSQQWNAQDRAEAEPPRVPGGIGKLVACVLEVGDLDRARLEHRSAPDRPADERKRELSMALGDWTVMRDEGQPVAVDAEDRRVDRRAEAGGALGNRVEHGLDIRRRVGDHAQDLAGGRLLIERVSELSPRLGQVFPEVAD